MPDSFSEIPQTLKITPQEKAVTMPGSALAAVEALSLRVLQVNVLGHEVHKRMKTKAHKAM